MRTKIQFIQLCLITCCGLSCTESEVLSYGEVNFIYFEQEAEEDQIFPEQNFNFFFQEGASTATLQIPVNVSGRFTGNDRSFSVNRVDSSSAVEGEHYSILTEANVIADGETGGFLNLQLIRSAELEEEIVSLILTLDSTDAFRPGDNDVMVIHINDFFTQPLWWPSSSFCNPNIGPFTQEKARLWLQFYGIDDGSDPWCCPPYRDPDSGKTDTSLTLQDVAAFRVYLIEMGDPNDENGERILDTLEYEECS